MFFSLVSSNGFNFAALLQIEALYEVDRQFLKKLQQHSVSLHADLVAYRQSNQTFTPLQISALLLACAPVLEEFIVELFAIQIAFIQSREKTLLHSVVLEFKKWFVQRRARRRLSKVQEITETFVELDNWLTQILPKDAQDRELTIAQLGKHYLTDTTIYAAEIEKLTRWCVLALTTPEGQIAVKDWVSFRLPQKTDHAHLVPIFPVPDDAVGRLEGARTTRRQRQGFELTDKRMSARQVQSEVDYCIYCHDHNGDFCSKGFPEKKDEPSRGLKIDPLGVTLTGCPLDEKISEMHLLKRQGHTIAALAMVMVDNPMCPATGHRICNDCMKACIYQKQDPVNIPQIETRVLTDVLDLPWGVEIYDLLTRWNPLRQRQYLPKPYNGLKVLIAGQGPAGFTLAHHLLMEGFAVVGIDGLKIEPLSADLVKQPIKDYHSLEEALDERVMAGFGGVAEYGITVRWDKNFLKLIYLSLSRRPYFQVFGSVRFGGTLTVEDAWELGFDHVAIAVGAGLPQALPIPGSLAPGMRQANDFLMALQLTGAAKADSLTNLQVRLPAVVIGGGLTGVDTATEVQAYYLVQIEKALYRYEKLCESLDESHLRAQFDAQSLEILDEFLAHGKALRTERQRAKNAGTEPAIQALLHQWGGVTIVYRRSLRESPAYIRNHEEVIKALEEGIFYLEGLEPQSVQLDNQGHVQAMVFQKRIATVSGEWQTIGEAVTLPARSVFVATGAQPNVAYEFEHQGHFQKKRYQYFTYHDINGQLALKPINPTEHCKTSDIAPFTSYEQNGHRVTFIGDTHPIFHGSVVRAIASAMRTYPHIVAALGEKVHEIGKMEEYATFAAKMQALLQAKIAKIQRHSASVVEIVVHAPMAAKKFRPGQFFRIQNFETLATVAGDTRLQTEAIAIRGAGVDVEKGNVSIMVLEQGASSRLFATLRIGELIAFMGPTGARTKIYPGGETIMLIGGRLGAANIRAVGPAWRAAGNKVLYIAGFQTADEVYCQTDLEAAADVIVWITASGQPINARRPQDCSATGDFLEILTRYAAGHFNQGKPLITLQEVTRVYITGSSRLVRMIQSARQGILRHYFARAPEFIASIHSTMQCMLKGVCAQCLQWQIDPKTGQRTKAVFACSWQDQPLDIVDIDNLDERLVQNHVQERLTNLWLDYLLSQHPVARV